MTARPPGVGSRPDGLPGQRRVRRPEPACAGRAPSVELVAVVTAPPRPAGRELQVERSPVHDAGRRRPVLTPSRLRDPEAVGAILGLARGSSCSPTTARSSRAALLDPPFGALNLHPSLLPRHRGASPIPAAILAGDRETGVTLMRMDAGLDTGPIVGGRASAARPGPRRRPSSRSGCAGLAADLLARSLEPWLRGDLPATPSPRPARR